MTTIAVLDYGSGNLRSAERAIARTGATVVVTDDERIATEADGLVVPGVGAFAACMQGLLSVHGERIIDRRLVAGRPILGICVGMQMLFDRSDEDPVDGGLGVISGEVRWIGDALPRPQMQWNQLRLVRADPLFEGLGDAPWVYFVHSLHGVPTDSSVVAATCDYGGTVNAVFRTGNVVATQFHPEKSGTVGLAMLRNFVRGLSAGSAAR